MTFWVSTKSAGIIFKEIISVFSFWERDSCSIVSVAFSLFFWVFLWWIRHEGNIQSGCSFFIEAKVLSFKYVSEKIPFLCASYYFISILLKILQYWASWNLEGLIFIAQWFRCSNCTPLIEFSVLVFCLHSCFPWIRRLIVQFLTRH